MATVPIGQILGTENLVGVIKRKASGVPNPFPPALFTTTEQVHKDYGKVRWYEGVQNTPKRNTYGNPATKRAGVGLNEQAVKLVHTFEYMQHPGDVLINLQQYDNPSAQEKGRMEISRQSGEFATRFQNFRIGMVASALRYGKLYFSSTDDLQGASATTTTLVVDYKLKATHQNQINTIIGTGWTNAAVNIEGDVTAIKNFAAQESGLPLKYAFYGSNIPTYLGTNAHIKNLLNTSPGRAEQILQGQQIVSPLMGLQWIDASSAFMLSGTTAVNWWGADTIVFTPEITSDWWTMIEGSVMVPRTMGIAGQTPEEALANIEEVYGMFQYSVVGHNPTSIEHYAGDTVLPWIVNPSAIFQADVTP